MNKSTLFSLLFLCACNQAEQQNTKDDLQKLSSLLSTANWQVTNGIDTSYIYFSQQMDNIYKTYEYRLFNGDSSVTHRGNIKPSGDSVIWNWNAHYLWLNKINDSSAKWTEKKTGEKYTMQKMNDSFILLKTSSVQITFKRTLPLSTFLVRAKYDYTHGTNLLDSGEIHPKDLIN